MARSSCSHLGNRSSRPDCAEIPWRAQARPAGIMVPEARWPYLTPPGVAAAKSLEAANQQFYASNQCQGARNKAIRAP